MAEEALRGGVLREAQTYATNFVFVFRNDDVRSVALTLGAICLNVRADLVDLVSNIKSMDPPRLDFPLLTHAE